MARVVPEKYKLLWVGDAVAHTGFATVTDNILRRLKNWDISVLGINYYGDPHDKPYKVYPAFIGGDYFGYNRLESVILTVKPNIVAFINDPWVLADYAKTLNKFPNIYRVAYVPIDGLNVPKRFVSVIDETFDVVIAYNEFGKKQLQSSGLSKARLEVIQHGVDRQKFYPVKDARKKLGIPEDWFIFGFVGRNQPRKRIDLLMYAFSLIAKDLPPEVKLYYHGAINDVGWDIEQLAVFLGIDDRLILSSRDITPVAGVDETTLNLIYNVMDVHVSATQGEGFGLTHAESAACGVPQIVPEWSGLSDWLKDAALFVPCSSIYVNTGGINTIGGVVHPGDLATAMKLIYEDKTLREELGRKAYERVCQIDFTWEFAAHKFESIFSFLIKGKSRDFATRENK